MSDVNVVDYVAQLNNGAEEVCRNFGRRPWNHAAELNLWWSFFCKNWGWGTFLISCAAYMKRAVRPPPPPCQSNDK